MKNGKKFMKKQQLWLPHCMSPQAAIRYNVTETVGDGHGSEPVNQYQAQLYYAGFDVMISEMKERFDSAKSTSGQKCSIF